MRGRHSISTGAVPAPIVQRMCIQKQRVFMAITNIYKVCLGSASDCRCERATDISTPSASPSVTMAVPP